MIKMPDGTERTHVCAYEALHTIGVPMCDFNADGSPKPGNTTVGFEKQTNVWGTDKSLIDSEEFCVECEREIPFHYNNCPLYKGGRS